jgi:hypothetical protein
MVYSNLSALYPLLSFDEKRPQETPPPVCATAPRWQEDVFQRLFQRIRTTMTTIVSFLVETHTDGTVFLKRQGSTLTASDFFLPTFTNIRSRIIFFTYFDTMTSTWTMNVWQYDGLQQHVEWRHIPNITRFGPFESKSCSNEPWYEGRITYHIKENTEHLVILPTSAEFYLFLQHVYCLSSKTEK